MLKVFKAMVFLDDSSGSLFHLDAVEIEGTIWFVPDWIENIAEQWKAPVRIVSVAHLEHQKMSGGPFAELVAIVVNEPLSKAILDGQMKPDRDSRYSVVESPDIRISTKKMN
jgi:hypothetical protein